MKLFASIDNENSIRTTIFCKIKPISRVKNRRYLWTVSGKWLTNTHIYKRVEGQSRIREWNSLAKLENLKERKSRGKKKKCVCFVAGERERERLTNSTESRKIRRRNRLLLLVALFTARLAREKSQDDDEEEGI